MRRLGVIPIATKFAPLALRIFFLSFSAQAREGVADEATSLAVRLLMEDGRRRRRGRGARRKIILYDRVVRATRPQGEAVRWVTPTTSSLTNGSYRIRLHK